MHRWNKEVVHYRIKIILISIPDQMKENERTNRINAARAGLLNFEVSPFLRAGIKITIIIMDQLIFASPFRLTHISTVFSQEASGTGSSIFRTS